MAQIGCTKCGNYCEIQVTASMARVLREGITTAQPETIRGVFICSQCSTQNVFEMAGNTITFLPGALFVQDLTTKAPSGVVSSFNDALRCFYGQGYRGTVAMCRSAVEDALDARGAKGNDLSQKIHHAQNTLGIVSYEEVAAAQNARLIGRNALHRGMEINHTQAMLALQGSLDFINFLYPP